ncbi:MAG: cell wall hydrolase [Lachnospiraceae bacterium]
MKKNWKKGLVLLLAFCVAWSAGGLGNVYAKSLEEIRQEQLENKKKKDAVESEKQDAQKVVDDLQDQADDLGATYNSYNKRLQNVNKEISDTEDAIASTTASISQLEKELEEAKEAEAEQYEGMKTRIQYMYENGTQSLFVSLLESGSMVEFLQKAEYVSAITSYDRKMMNTYAELQTSIQEKSASLSEKKTELSAYNDTLSAKQDELDGLVNDAGSAYSAKKGEVSAAQMSVEEYEAKIQEFRDNEAALEGQAAAAQAALAQQILAQQPQQQPQQPQQPEGENPGETGGENTGSTESGGADNTGQTPQIPSENTGGSISYSDADLKLMAAIIQAEAGGESYAGQLAVGTVIMNRVKSSLFPNTLSGVIYQKNQFQPVRDGHLALILERGPNESCTNAAKQVLNGYRSGDWLFFMTKYWADYYGITGYSMIGNHAFFRNWGAN